MTLLLCFRLSTAPAPDPWVREAEPKLKELPVTHYMWQEFMLGSCWWGSQIPDSSSDMMRLQRHAVFTSSQPDWTEPFACQLGTVSNGGSHPMFVAAGCPGRY